MRKPTPLPLACLALLLVLVFVVTLLSPKNQDSPLPQDSPLTASAPPSEQKTTNTRPKEYVIKGLTQFSNPQKSKPTSPSLNPSQDSVAPAHRPLQQELLQRRLLRDESLLTRELLADGTELIHLNGTQGHFSAASIAPDGTIETQCHSSFEGLINQASLPVTAAAVPSSTK
ncbi:MAG: hypothetical protein ACSHYB_07025 [Roseibacillus sp.]